MRLRSAVENKPAYARAASRRILFPYARAQLAGKLPRVSEETIRSVAWDALLGSPGALDTQVKLSLAASDLSQSHGSVRIGRRWDIDCLLVPLESLGAPRCGFWHYPAPRSARTLLQQWRVRISQYGIDNMRSPHEFIGTTASGGMIYHIFAFFPGLPKKPRWRGRGSRLTRAQRRFFNNQIFYPALRETYPPHDLQHHPWSFEAAEDRARARQKESVTRGERAYIEWGYYLENDRRGDGRLPLDTLWRKVGARLRRGHPEWHGVQLVAVVCGTKLQLHSHGISETDDSRMYGGRPGLRGLLQSKLDSSFHIHLVDRQRIWVDLAYEDIAVYHGEEGEGEEAVVLLRRTCCNDSDMEQLGLSSKRQIYHWQGTADASSVRASPGVSSAASLGLPGELSQKLISFSQPTVDSFKEQSRGHTDPVRRQRLVKALITAIQRIYRSIATQRLSPSPGFAARQEYRVCIDFLDNFDPPATQLSLDNGIEGEKHWPYSAVSLADALDFIHWNLSRWLFALCAVLSPPRPTLDDQHPTHASVCAFMDVLNLTVNSEHIGRHLRHSHYRYARPSEESEEETGGGASAGAVEGQGPTLDSAEYGAYGYITVMPHYEKSKLYHAAPHPALPSAGKSIRWWLARPRVPHPRDPNSSKIWIKLTDRSADHACCLPGEALSNLYSKHDGIESMVIPDSSKFSIGRQQSLCRVTNIHIRTCAQNVNKLRGLLASMPLLRTLELDAATYQSCSFWKYNSPLSAQRSKKILIGLFSGVATKSRDPILLQTLNLRGLNLDASTTLVEAIKVSRLESLILQQCSNVSSLFSNCHGPNEPSSLRDLLITSTTLIEDDRNESAPSINTFLRAATRLERLVIDAQFDRTLEPSVEAVAKDSLTVLMLRCTFPVGPPHIYTQRCWTPRDIQQLAERCGNLKELGIHFPPLSLSQSLQNQDLAREAPQYLAFTASLL